MAIKKPLRMGVQLVVRLESSVNERLRKNSQAMGLTLTDYLSALVNGYDPILAPGVDMADISLAGRHILSAICLLDSDGGRDEAIKHLRVAHDHIVVELRKAKPVYDAALEAQGKNGSWGDLEHASDSL